MASIFPADDGGESNNAYEARGFERKGNSFPQGRLAVLLFILAVTGWFLAGAMWSSKSAPQAAHPPVAGPREELLPASVPQTTDAPAAIAREVNLSTPPPPASGTPTPQLRETNTPTPASGVQEVKQEVTREANPVTSGTASAVGSQGAPPAGALPYLGLRGAKYHKGKVSGLKIMEVFPGSPAALAGLRSGHDPSRVAGDIIVRVNDRPLGSEDDLRAVLRSCAPGDEIRFLVTSTAGGLYQTIPVTLGAASRQFSVQGYTAATVVAAARSEGGEDASKSRGASISMTNTEQEIFDMVNKARVEQGLSALSSNPRLLRVARQYSKQMAAGGFFSHTGTGGEDVVDRLKIANIKGYRGVGENIFYSENEKNVPRTAVQGWLASPGHRKNMLSPSYRETGVGMATAPQNKVYVTQVFLEP